MNDCIHSWHEVASLSQYAAKVKCYLCEDVKIIKPRIYVDPYQYPIVANEYLAYKLLALIASRGVVVRVPRFYLAYNNIRYFDRHSFPWTHPIIMFDDIGEHTRISGNNYGDDLIWPGWVYYFDRWIGRLDGDSNLIFFPDKFVSTIDFNMSFCWACGRFPHIIYPNFMDVPCHPKIEENKFEYVRDVIHSLSDAEIFHTLNQVDNTILSTQALTAYFTGLCLRRDIL